MFRALPHSSVGRCVRPGQTSLALRSAGRRSCLRNVTSRKVSSMSLFGALVLSTSSLVKFGAYKQVPSELINMLLSSRRGYLQSVGRASAKCEIQFIQFKHLIVHKDAHLQETTIFIAVEDSALCVED